MIKIKSLQIWAPIPLANTALSYWLETSCSNFEWITELSMTKLFFPGSYENFLLRKCFTDLEWGFLLSHLPLFLIFIVSSNIKSLITYWMSWPYVTVVTAAVCPIWMWFRYFDWGQARMNLVLHKMTWIFAIIYIGSNIMIHLYGWSLLLGINHIACTTTILEKIVIEYRAKK